MVPRTAAVVVILPLVAGCAGGVGSPPPVAERPAAAEPEADAPLLAEVDRFAAMLDAIPEEPERPAIEFGTLPPTREPAGVEVEEVESVVEPLEPAPPPAAGPPAWEEPTPAAAPPAAGRDGLGEAVLARLNQAERPAVGVFRHELLRLVADDDAVVPAAPAAALRPEERRIIDTLAGALAAFDAELADGRGFDPARKVAPILDAADALRREAGLVLPTVEICSEVRMFGDYDPLPREFPVGTPRRVVLYVEVDNFHTQATADGRHEARISLSAVLYDPEGKPVMSLPPTEAGDVTRRPRRDFFVCGLLTLPGQTAPGPHTLKVTVRDEIGRRVAQNSVRVEFTAGSR